MVSEPHLPRPEGCSVFRQQSSKLGDLASQCPAPMSHEEVLKQLQGIRGLMSSSLKQSEVVKKLLDIQREEQARTQELARSNAEMQEILIRMKALFMKIARDEEEGLLQLDEHPAEDAPQVFDGSPKPDTYIMSNGGAGKGQASEEEVSKAGHMESKKSPVQMPVEELVDELPPNQMSVPPVSRTRWCTGVVVSVASGLLDVCLPGTGARATAWVDAAPYFQRAVICDNPRAQLVHQGNIVDLFASALVPAEVAEMKVAVEILAAFKLVMVRLMFDPGGEFSAMAAEFLKLEGKLLEGGGNVTEIEVARELHD